MAAKATQRFGRILVLPVGAVTLTLLAGCGVVALGQTEDANLTLRGDITVPGTRDLEEGEPCEAQRGYDDIALGAQVVVRDEAGETIGLGRLGGGKKVVNPEKSMGGDNCVFPFEVADLPAGKKVYGVEVSHRGELKQTPAEITQPLHFTLGD